MIWRVVGYGLLALAALLLPAARAPAEDLSPPVERAACAGTSVGFQVMKVPRGPALAVWYPSSAAEHVYDYSSLLAGSVAFEGAPARCGRVPLVVFSHGLGGCGTQFVAFTEALARAGYVVAAPDHGDHICSVQSGALATTVVQSFEDLFRPQTWTDAIDRTRTADVARVIDWLLASADYGMLIDSAAIGVVGYSMGGYAALASVGAWTSDRDPRIRAALLFSPFALPFLYNGDLKRVRVPVMYQSGDWDWGVTSLMRGRWGVATIGTMPKYYVQLAQATHFEWTNLACIGDLRLADCVNHRDNVRLILTYGIAFFDRYLKSNGAALDHLDGGGLSIYQRPSALRVDRF